MPSNLKLPYVIRCRKTFYTPKELEHIRLYGKPPAGSTGDRIDWYVSEHRSPDERIPGEVWFDLPYTHPISQLFSAAKLLTYREALDILSADARLREDGFEIIKITRSDLLQVII